MLKTYSCSTQLSTKIFLVINVEMPTIVSRFYLNLTMLIFLYYEHLTMTHSRVEVDFFYNHGPKIPTILSCIYTIDSSLQCKHVMGEMTAGI